jgi:hypothetical protein
MSATLSFGFRQPNSTTIDPTTSSLLVILPNIFQLDHGSPQHDIGSFQVSHTPSDSSTLTHILQSHHPTYMSITLPHPKSTYHINTTAPQQHT